MNEIIQSLECDATNGKENFCYISEKRLEAIKKLSTIEDNEFKTLNKGIDELLIKYEEEMNIYTSEINHWTDERKNSKDSNYKEYCMCIFERNKEAKILTRIFIQDLKKLKGE